jgi:predicted RNA methylase
VKLSKAEIRAHDQVMQLVHSDRPLNDEEKEFILVNFNEGATNINSAAGAFFTPRSLARDFAIEINGGDVIDLCAGIGMLSYAVEHKCDSLTCVEINAEYIEVGKRILPGANWIHSSVFDVNYSKLWDWAISNPPFGAIKENSFKGVYSGAQFEYKVMEVASKISHYGAFIIPQMSANFRFSGSQNFKEEESDKARKFREQTGILMEPNCGIDTAMYKDDWKGVSPICEIVICEFEHKPKSQLDLFAEAA